MSTRAFAYIRQHVQDPRLTYLLAIGLTAVMLAAFMVFSGTGRHIEPQGIEPKRFTLTPTGEDASRLGPIRVTFESPPAERDGSRIMQIEPAAPGSYAWATERTLVFQPDFPGLLRGKEYTVRVAPQEDAGLSRERRATFRTEGVLKVETVIPAADDVEVPVNAQVYVQFSRSVAPLTLLSEQQNGAVIASDPPLTGQGEWLNTSLYRFVPDNIQPNTQYQLRIQAGLTSAADGVLEEDYVWSFTSYGPAVDSVSPEPNTRFAGPFQTVVARFNQPMDRASVEAGLRVLAPDGTPVAGALAWSDGDRSVELRPSEALAPETSYRVVMAKGLRGAAGGETKTEWSSTFITVGKPGVRRMVPWDGMPNAPRYGIQIEFTNPMNVDTLEDKISVSGLTKEEIDQSYYASEMNLFVSVRLKPSTDYTVTIADGMEDRYGQPLAGFRIRFTTGSRDPFVSFAVPNIVTTYSASVEPLLYYHSTNTSEATFTLYPLTRDEFLNLLRTNRISNDPRSPYRPSQPAMRTWTEAIVGERDEVVLQSTSLSGGGTLPEGFYYVRSNDQYFGQMAFAVVDAALVTKLSFDELLVWAVDIDSGRPMSGFRLHAYGPGLQATEATTNDQGLASFPVTHIVDFDFRAASEGRNYAVLLDGAGGSGAASTMWQQETNVWQLGIPQEYYPREYIGYVYTDRPIYRPGEEVFLKGVVRRDDDVDYRVPDDAPAIDVVITDSRGKELLRNRTDLNEFGTFERSLKLPADASTGDYTINLKNGNDFSRGSYVAGSSFVVAEFRVPEFKVAVEAPRPAYVSGEQIDAAALASFFFGGPVESAGVQWSVTAWPYVMRPKGFEGYSFADYDNARRAVSRDVIRARGSGVTDNTGSSRYTIPATVIGEEGPQQYTISAEVKDQNGQTVAANTVVTVHPAAVYAGIRPAQYLTTAGKEATVKLATVDADGKALGRRTVTVDLYERRWVTTKVQNEEGARRYKSDPVDTYITSMTATTDDEGRATASFTPTKTGTLRLVATVRDSAGRVSRSATYLYVAGEGYAGWAVTNDATIKLVADKERYDLGDTAEVLVPTPYPGAIGLVTVERGKVIDRYLQAFPSSAEVLRIPLGERTIPDVFVSVVLYRPPTAEDPVPRYKVGYVQLPVSTASRVLNVGIEPDRAQAKPGDKVRYDLRVTDSSGRGVRAELSVAVVDKAVLSLAEERGPDGLKAFWYERGLGVTTASSLAVLVNRTNDVISEARAGGKGGGGVEDDRIRKDFRNTAYWQAQLVTDNDGRASVEVVMPDNLTTWRLQARAVSGDILVGECVHELLSTQPLLVRPALPRFLRVGDHAVIRALVRNSTSDAADVTVGIEADGLILREGAERTVRIESATSVMVEWPADATAEGTARLTFTAKSANGLSDAIVQQLPVKMDLTQEAMATGGVVKDVPLSEALYLPSYAVTEHGSLTVGLKPSLVGSLETELGAFGPFSWEGNDIVASRLSATLAVRRAQRASGVNQSSSDSRIDADLASLVSAQRPDGGWSWCRTCSTSDEQITAGVLIALGEAMKDGRKVDAGVLSRAQGYLNAFINRLTDVNHPADPNEKAYMVYALALSGQPETRLSVMRALFEQNRTKLNSWGRAYLLRAMVEAGLTKKDAQVVQLLNDISKSVIASANGNHWEDVPAKYSPDTSAVARTHTNVRGTAVVLSALVRIDPAHPLIEETVRWLTVARPGQRYPSTPENASVVYALAAFAAETRELSAAYGYSVDLEGRSLVDGRFSGAGASPVEEKLPLSSFGLGRTSILDFARDFSQRGRMYYTMDLRYGTPAPGVEALNRGFAVSHQYSPIDEPGRSIDRASIGDIVRVKVTVIAPADRNYVAIDDYLPAGLEAIDPKLKTTDVALRARLDEERRQLAGVSSGLGYCAPWLGWYYSPFDQVDIRDDRVTLQARRVAKGIYEYVYYARATTVGDFFVAPTHAEESYFPEVFGRSDSSRFAVQP